MWAFFIKVKIEEGVISGIFQELIQLKISFLEITFLLLEDKALKPKTYYYSAIILHYYYEFLFDFS